MKNTAPAVLRRVVPEVMRATRTDVPLATDEIVLLQDALSYWGRHCGSREEALDCVKLHERLGTFKQG